MTLTIRWRNYMVLLMILVPSLIILRVVFTTPPRGKCQRCWDWKRNLTITPDRGFCSVNETTHIKLVILVNSKITHVNQRTNQRKLLEAHPHVKMNVKLLFVFGRTKSKHEQLILHSESVKYSDILQFDFADAYRNFSLGVQNAFHWLEQNCKEAKFILKTTSDVYLHLKGLLDFLELNENSISNLISDTECNPPNRPIQDEKSRFYTPFEQYPYNMYPKFCAGHCIIMSLKMMKVIKREAIRYHPNHEDVMIGIAALMANKHVRNIPVHPISFCYKKEGRNIKDEEACKILQEDMEVSDECSPLKDAFILTIHVHENPSAILQISHCEHVFSKYPLNLTKFELFENQNTRRGPLPNELKYLLMDESHS